MKIMKYSKNKVMNKQTKFKKAIIKKNKIK